MNNKISISFSVNERYVPYLCVAINSIRHSKRKESYYSIYIIHSSLRSDIQKTIQEWLYCDPGIEIYFVDVTDKIGNYDFYIKGENGREYITKETYYRLMLPELLPAESKILYLDADIVVKHDLADLFMVDLNDKLLAAVPDMADNWKCNIDQGLRTYRSSVLKVNDQNSYFNAGILLLNLKKFRDEYSDISLLNLATERDWKKHDQDVLNMICQNNYVKLHYKWNLIETESDIMNMWYEKSIISLYKEAVNAPYVIHYAANKPWLKRGVNFETDFWENAIDTPWFDRILEALIDSELKNKDALAKYTMKALSEKKIGLKFIIECFHKWVEVNIQKEGKR